MKISIANTHTKTKKLDASMVDKVSGKKLSTQAGRVARKLGKKALTRKLESTRTDLTPEDAAAAAQLVERVEPKVFAKVVSTSGDVIFSPGTQATRYSAGHAVKTNLERRIPGATVRVLDIAGDGLVTLTMSMSFEVGQETVDLRAASLASATDMTITQAVVTVGNRIFDIDPVNQPRTPEATSAFLQQLAINCASSAGG